LDLVDEEGIANMGMEWWIRAVQLLREKLSRRDEEGQGLVEYALILAFVVIVVYFALKLLQPQISSTLNNVSNSL
jgi:Flp pilus assembly pilin Flp